MSRILQLERLLFLLVIIFLPTQLGKHWWPDFSFIYSLPIDYLAPTLYGWDLLVISLLVCWLWRKPTINWLAVKLVLIYLLCLIPSFTQLTNWGTGLVRLEQYLIAASLAIYLASVNLKTYWPLLRLGLAIAVIYQSLIAISQFSLGHSLGWWILGERDFSLANPVIAKFNWYNQLFLRPYGTFPHPNVLAAFMVVAIPLILKTAKLSLWSKLAIGLAMVTTLISFSRSATVVLATELIYLLRHQAKWLILIILLVLPVVYVRFNSALNFDALSITRRAELATNSLILWQNSPWLGIGLNNFIPEAASSFLLSGHNRFLQPVHNILLLQLVETGWIGLFGLVIMMLVAIITVYKVRDYHLLFIWLVILGLGMFDHYWLTLPQGIRLWWIIWGLSVNYLFYRAKIN